MRPSSSLVTAVGIRLREMRLLVHRGQALLLLVVGALAGAAVTGAVLERGGFLLPGAFNVGGIFAPPEPAMPGRIVIGGSGTTSSDSGVVPGSSPVTVPPVGPAPTSSTSMATAPEPARSPATTVVPATVYTYPPDDRGGGGSGRGGPGPGGKSGRG